jgi:hypothetical protein
MLRFLLLAAVALIFRMENAAADDSVWSGLVLARNCDSPKAPPAELARFESRLRNVFGYNQFELLGRHREIMDDPRERWLIPGQDFSLRVAARENAPHNYLLGLQLFQGHRLLVETNARLGLQSPLFIRGPQYGDGQLIVVLLVK